MTPRITELAGAAADDAGLVAQITDLVNAAYAAGEAGLWRPGWTRSTPAEVSSMVAGGMLVATDDDRIVGCAHLRDLDATTADLGFISTAPDRWGGGTGAALDLEAGVVPRRALRVPRVPQAARPVNDRAAA